MLLAIQRIALLICLPLGGVNGFYEYEGRSDRDNYLEVGFGICAA